MYNLNLRGKYESLGSRYWLSQSTVQQSDSGNALQVSLNKLSRKKVLERVRAISI
jgi:hypothetical protein